MAERVPRHDVISRRLGRVAGGPARRCRRCCLQDEFEHVADATRRGTTNRFDERWVNKTDIRELLTTRDWSAGPLVSLLDSRCGWILSWRCTGNAGDRSGGGRGRMLRRDLTVFLSLTNLRGRCIRSMDSPGGVEETTSFFGDESVFQAVRRDSTQPGAGWTRRLWDGSYGAAGRFRAVGKCGDGYGGVPNVPGARVLVRGTLTSTPPTVERCMDKAEGRWGPYRWSRSFRRGWRNRFQTLNVDGGITKTIRSDYAHDYLAGGPGAQDQQLER